MLGFDCEEGVEHGGLMVGGGNREEQRKKCLRLGFIRGSVIRADARS